MNHVIIKCEPRCASSRLVSAYRLQGYFGFIVDSRNYKSKRVERELDRGKPCVVKDHSVHWMPKQHNKCSFIHLRRRSVFAQAMSKIVVHTLKGRVSFNPYHPRDTDTVDVVPWPVERKQVQHEMAIVHQHVEQTQQVLSQTPHRVIYTEDLVKDDRLIVELTGSPPDYARAGPYVRQSRLSPQFIVSNYLELKQYFEPEAQT